MPEQTNTANSLAHTKWNCKYHIMFAPKYRRKVFYEEKRLEIREILRTLCRWKGVELFFVKIRQNGIIPLQFICQFGIMHVRRICHDVEGIAEGEGIDAGGGCKGRRRTHAHLRPL